MLGFRWTMAHRRRFLGLTAALLSAFVGGFGPPFTLSRSAPVPTPTPTAATVGSANVLAAEPGGAGNPLGGLVDAFLGGLAFGGSSFDGEAVDPEQYADYLAGGYPGADSADTSAPGYPGYSDGDFDGVAGTIPGAGSPSAAAPGAGGSGAPASDLAGSTGTGVGTTAPTPAVAGPTPSPSAGGVIIGGATSTQSPPPPTPVPIAQPTVRATPAPTSRSNPTPGTVATPRPPSSPVVAVPGGTSAAERFGWGTPNRVDEFTTGLGPDWGIYNGPGHAGNGRRTPDAVSVQNGVLALTGDSAGNTAGMAWNPGQKYGRWEGRVRAPASDETYNALLLLWPDAENFPVGGEIDFMEMTDHTRRTTELFLHYGANNNQISGEVEINGAEWHNWAVEWTPTRISAYVDGEEWFTTTDQSKFPPGPMHLCIQLDWFPNNGSGSVQESAMYVDWVKQYPL